MKIGVFPNPNCDKDLTVAKGLISKIKELGATPCVWKEYAEQFPDVETFSDQAINAVISLGGDGTIISVFKFCAFHNVPLLGVNMGTVGFLTETSLKGLDKALEHLVKGKYRVYHRMLITARQDGMAYVALNDVAINKNAIGSAIPMSVSIGNELLGQVRADGYIVSSPTGSTAYSLSAGGPIVSPKSECMLLTPLNAHSLTSRPIVISPDEKVTIEVSGDASLVVDGRIVAPAKKVLVEKCNYDCPFVYLNRPGFYEKIKMKLVGKKEEY
ncbi:MAG: NAD(+)/NADH kinase [Clostridia bacterium]|nr:NAD(+)/NADH kinase [Clostridia bacterium]